MLCILGFDAAYMFIQRTFMITYGWKWGLTLAIGPETSVKQWCGTDKGLSHPCVTECWPWQEALSFLCYINLALTRV